MELNGNKCVMVIDAALPLGIIQIPVPVLKADREKIKEIRQRLYQPEFADFQYFGIGLCGDNETQKVTERLFSI